MKKIILVALAFALSAPAFASESSVIKQLSSETGVSERHVRMIVGNRTPFAEYAYTYDREYKRFSQALGPERTQRLLSGQPVRLPSGNVVSLVDRAPRPAG